jgi:hypothetical protein
MRSTTAEEAEAALASDGTNDGRVSVADASPFVPGAVVVLSGTSTPRAAFRIAAIAANQLTLTPILPGEPGAEQLATATATVAAFTAAGGARISQGRQFVPGDEPQPQEEE